MHEIEGNNVHYTSSPQITVGIGQRVTKQPQGWDIQNLRGKMHPSGLRLTVEPWFFQAIIIPDSIRKRNHGASLLRNHQSDNLEDGAVFAARNYSCVLLKGLPGGAGLLGREQRQISTAG